MAFGFFCILSTGIFKIANLRLTPQMLHYNFVLSPPDPALNGASSNIRLEWIEIVRGTRSAGPGRNLAGICCGWCQLPCACRPSSSTAVFTACGERAVGSPEVSLLPVVSGYNQTQEGCTRETIPAVSSFNGIRRCRFSSSIGRSSAADWSSPQSSGSAEYTAGDCALTTVLANSASTPPPAWPNAGATVPKVTGVCADT